MWKRIGVLAVASVTAGLMVVLPPPPPVMAQSGPTAAACPEGSVPRGQFSDVGTGAHAFAIDCAAWWGLASGRSDGTFGAGDPVTRGQLASFLYRFLTESGGDVADGPSDEFTDVAGNTHEVAINALAAIGVARGYADGRFGPGDRVNRAQTASMFARTLEHRTGVPLDAGTDQFGDDDGSVHEPAINALAALGAIAGFDATRFGPSATLTRGQTASVLVRILGHLVTEGLASPPDPPLPSEPVDVAAGAGFSCAVMADGTARCWGVNDNGRIGDGTTTDRPAPVAVKGLTNVAAIATGLYHACAALTDGTARCWGSNMWGELGDGTRTDRTSPVAVRGLTNVADISAAGAGSCALLTDGTVRCWGMDLQSTVQGGTIAETSTTEPVPVEGLSRATAISRDGGHACALLVDRSVRCWGDNSYGELGDGTTTTQVTPVAVHGLTDVATISAGRYHSCAVLMDGTARCWGFNSQGQLGDGTSDGVQGGSVYPGLRRLTPVAVHGLTNAVDISAGSTHSCATLADGTARCWGENHDGILGDGSNIDRVTPVPVQDLSNVTAISASNAHSCAISAETARCWGNNSYGQLGDGTRTRRYTPALVVFDRN